MSIEMNFAGRVLEFNTLLSIQAFDLPSGYRIINPHKGDQQDLIRELTTAFYQKYYPDNNPRRIILGSSPARQGSAVTGIPFEDAKHLQNETGIFINKFYINKSSSGFLYDVMTSYGGRQKFYMDFYMNFVCPLGIAKTNAKGNEVNCNYYENKQLQESLSPFILQSLRAQLDFGVDTSVAYCIGSGENYAFLSQLNQQHHFFDTIIPLEHTRFITQYQSKNQEMYKIKYLTALHR